MAQSDIIKSLGEKVSILIEENERLRKLSENTGERNERLNAENRELKQTLAALEKRVNVLELGSGISGASVDTKQAQARINRIVREIDKCLALMNR